MNQLEVVGLQARRVADTAVGAVTSTGERISENVQALRRRGERERRITRFRRNLDTGVRKAERRGATARRRLGRELKRRRQHVVRTAKQYRREAETRVRSLTS
jgi:hypothetical protein